MPFNSGSGHISFQNLLKGGRKMAKVLWQPSEERMKSSTMYKFLTNINEKYNKEFKEYEELYQ